MLEVYYKYYIIYDSIYEKNLSRSLWTISACRTLQDNIDFISILCK